MIRSGVLALVLSTLPVVAFACLACIEMPAESLADRAIAAEVVVLLRPKEDDPFRYAPVTFLKGVGADLPPVPFLVSRSAAILLTADPGSATVGLYSAAHGWTLQDQGTEALGRILSNALTADLSTPEARLAFFGPLVTHPELAVQQMALVELAGLPYTVLRQAPARPSLREVAGRAFDPLWSPWAPVMILLLGTSKDPADARFVRAAVKRLAASRHATHLAAWATALVETDGLAGVAALAQDFPAPDQSPEVARQLAVALSEHAARRDPVGDAALVSLRSLAETRPEVTGLLARALLQREDWSGADGFAVLIAEGRVEDPADEFVVRDYIAAATKAVSSSP